MKTLEQKVNRLCEIITSNDKKTVIKDGAFDGYYQCEQVEETTYNPSYSLIRRLIAKRKLKSIYKKTDDPKIKSKCKEGFTNSNAEAIEVESVFFAGVLSGFGYLIYRGISHNWEYIDKYFSELIK